MFPDSNSPSASAVEENAAMLFCYEAPEMFWTRKLDTWFTKKKSEPALFFIY